VRTGEERENDGKRRTEKKRSESVYGQEAGGLASKGVLVVVWQPCSLCLLLCGVVVGECLSEKQGMRSAHISGGKYCTQKHDFGPGRALPLCCCACSTVHNYKRARREEETESGLGWVKVVPVVVVVALANTHSIGCP
jgi:hypothetical protein